MHEDSWESTKVAKEMLEAQPIFQQKFSAKRNVDHFLVRIYEVSNQFQFVLSKTQLEKSVTIRTMKGFQKWRKWLF